MTELTADAFAARFPGLAAGLDSAQVERLLAALQVFEVQSGEAVIAEWTKTDALFLVWEGELTASTDTPHGEQVVGRVGPGDLLGDVSLLDPGPATATVVADQGCVALRLPRAEFEELRASDPVLASALLRSLLRSLSARVRSATVQLDGLVAAGRSTTDELVDVHRSLYAGARP